MKRLTKTVRVTSFLLLFLLYAPGLLAQYTPVTVLVSVNDSETALDIKSPSQCARGGKMGCIEAKKNKKIRIKVTMRGGARCSSGGKWALSEIYLGGEDSDSKPASWGGLSKAVNDFDVDAASGRVTPERGSNGNQLKFINQNTQQYDVWYKVTATCGDRTIEMDPRIRNRGIG